MFKKDRIELELFIIQLCMKLVLNEDYFNTEYKKIFYASS